MRLHPFISLILIMTICSSCAVKKFKNLDYKAPVINDAPAPTLNVFQKKKVNSLQPVLIFIYGGNWNSGRKEIYNYIGRNFARRGVTLVMPDYTKSPVANYDDMTRQIAQCIQWTKSNIADYGGDPDNIYLTGHSAGGHLGALAVMNPSYGVAQNDVAGIILNDAAGLDMFSYLKEHPPTTTSNYLSTWTDDPAQWKNASPYYFINSDMPAFKMYVGTKTYKSIDVGNSAFAKAAQNYQPELHIEYLDKKHVPMVTHLFWPWSSRYDEISAFMKRTKDL
jgi:arylformamidase